MSGSASPAERMAAAQNTVCSSLKSTCLRPGFAASRSRIVPNIVNARAVPVQREDLADAVHPEGRELGRPKRAHARAAVHVDAPRQRPEDLFVPDRGHALEIAVDDAYGLRAPEGDAVEVALGHGR